ncbi:MAG: GNAT family N-acetyltransferase [Candidatus Odinarchaeota archaeon]
MKLKSLSINDMEQIRQWRNEQLQMLRTSFPLTKEMQEDFYNNEICNRQSNSRYWGVWTTCENVAMDLIGMCGIENIQWENRLGEISLLLNPKLELGFCMKEALNLLLDKAFFYLNLENVFTEVYDCSLFKQFWIKIYNKYNNGIAAPKLPNKKYYNGVFYDSLHLNINKEKYSSL